jgi:CubicO group peptidase (beta-lactamase class C family)
MTRRRPFLSHLTILALVLTGLASAQASPPGDLEPFVDSVAQDVIESKQSVGLSIGIAKADETWLAKGYGLANLELNVPATAQSVYRIGSITKQFTAVAILLLAEDGKLSLDDSLTRYLPDYPTQGHEITVRHLLQHTSGIKSFTNLPSYRPDWHQPVTHEEIIDRFKDEPPNFAPSEEFKYCNSGYYLLGVIIEEASGQTYEEFLQERLFSPLELKATLYDRHGRIIPNRVSGYGRAWVGGVRNAPYVNMGQPFAAGALASTVEDLIRWQRGLVNHTLLEPASWKAMTTPGKLNHGKTSVYGLGVFLRKLGDHPTIRHGGGINGFRSDLAYFPEIDVTIAVLANKDGTRPEKVTDRIAQHLFQSDLQSPEQAETVESPANRKDEHDDLQQ